MTAQEYKAGDVAMVTAVNRPTPYRAYYDSGMWREYGSRTSCLTDPTTVRPLAVLDTNASESTPQSILRFAATTLERKLGADYAPEARDLRDWADQIEAQTKRPKPEEPQGLGAVVEDTEGQRWVRTERGTGCRNPWQSALSVKRPDTIATTAWTDLDLTDDSILSAGV